MPDRDREARPATKDYDELLLGVRRSTRGWPSSGSACRSLGPNDYLLAGRKALGRDQQKGHSRAPYGAELLKRLSKDLQQRLGRGFSERNLEQMRQFFLLWPKSQTLSAASVNTNSAFPIPPAFHLACPHYVRHLSVPDSEARRYYERETLRGGWSVRQLDRQIATLTYQRSSSRQLPTGLSPPVATADTDKRSVRALQSGSGTRVPAHVTSGTAIDTKTGRKTQQLESQEAVAKQLPG